MWKCKHCNKEFDYSRTTDKANHSRHCDQNPNKQKSLEALTAAKNEWIIKQYGEYAHFTVSCATCGAAISVNEREKLFPQKDNYYCSRSCSSSVGGRNKAKKFHPDDTAHYRVVSMRHHTHACVICGESNIVAVHHLNEDHMDNSPQNLVPLCPTHHQYMHSRFKHMIEQQVLEYVKKRWSE